jgi:predicted DNA-binding transcriptional regulator YafY
VATRTDQPAAEPRSYRVSRINELTATGDTFDRPTTFDLASYWRNQISRFDRHPHQGGEGRVRLSPRGMRLTPMLGEVVMRVIERTAGPPDTDGWVTATLPIETIDYMTSQLLRLGTDVEVLEPAELRANMAAVTAELASRYRQPARHNARE